MEHNIGIATVALTNRSIMKKSIARTLVSAAMIIGLGVTLVMPSSADSDKPSKQTDYISEFKSTKGSFESALDAYKKATGNTKTAKAAKAALKEAAHEAQKKAEIVRLAALQQVFATYTDALNRASAAYTTAIIGAGKNAAAKNAAKNAKSAAVAAATSIYNSAKAELKPLAKLS